MLKQCDPHRMRFEHRRGSEVQGVGPSFRPGILRRAESNRSHKYSMNPLEQRLRYKFRNPLLLAEALTHPSLGHETQRHHFDNQRLEYLGDAVLQLIFTEYLFDRFPDAAEGHLTKIRARLVSREGLRLLAQALDLGRYLMMGRGEESSGGRERASALSDAYEALIGAIYLDSDHVTVRRVVLHSATSISICSIHPPLTPTRRSTPGVALRPFPKQPTIRFCTNPGLNITSVSSPNPLAGAPSWPW